MVLNSNYRNIHNRKPSRLAAEAQSGPDSDVIPLGTRSVLSAGSGSESVAVTLPKDRARQLGIEAGDELRVGYDPVLRQFVYETPD